MLSTSITINMCKIICVLSHKFVIIITLFLNSHQFWLLCTEIIKNQINPNHVSRTYLVIASLPEMWSGSCAIPDGSPTADVVSMEGFHAWARLFVKGRTCLTRAPWPCPTYDQ